MSRRAGPAPVVRTGGGRSEGNEMNVKKTLAYAGATVALGATGFLLYKHYKKHQENREDKKDEPKSEGNRNKTVAIAVVGAAAVTVAVALKIKRSKEH